MDDDSESSYRSARPRLSTIPSWVMLGFVLGALFVIALPPGEKETAPPVMPKPAEPPPPAPPKPAVIEAVFADWGKNAVWDKDVTEVALWSTEANAFADFFEIRRVGDLYYFRTIPRLTRRPISPPTDSPLQFTETEEHYREWLQHGRTDHRPELRPGPGK